MCPEAVLKVGGEAYITLCGNGNALKKIDILHDRPPSPKLRRTPFALQRRRQLVTEKVACHLERRVVEAALQCKEPLLQVTFTLT
jgi:hypothetical protein